jgi:replicative DNA helicase
VDGRVPAHEPDAGSGSGSGARDHADLVIRAEQAFLGAVMSDPERQARLLDLVRPADMRRPYHGQVLAAMQRLRARGAAPDPLQVRAELATDPDLPPRVALDGVLLAGLLEAAPRSGHAPAYAAMVIDHGIRQRLGLAGSRMVQATEVGELDPALQVTARAAREAAACQARWQALPQAVRLEVPGPSGYRAGQAEEAAWQLRAASEEIARARQGDRADPGDLAGSLEQIAQHVARAAASSRSAGRTGLRAPGEQRPRGPAAEAAGEQFLRDLAAGPSQVATVGGWLRPGYFARPVHGQLYALIRDMHRVGQPIDPITIAWEAARRGIKVDQSRLEGGTASHVRAAAREVRRRGILARISKAGRDLEDAVSDPRLRTAGLLQGASFRLRDLEREPGLEPARAARSLGTTTYLGSSLRRFPHLPQDRPQRRDGGAAAEPA